MAKKSLSDILYYDSERDYDVRKGDVMYLDAKPLKRRRSMGTAGKIFVSIVAVVAVLIGYQFINNLVIAPMQEAASIQENTLKNLERQASVETIPLLADVINRSDDDIRALFDSCNYVCYDMTEANGGTLTLYKLPSDVSLEEGEALLTRGVDSLNSEQASRLLQGSWYFAADRVGGTTMVTRYVDFSTGVPEVALQNALAKEGFDPASQTDAGEDDSGNTYITGNIDINGENCTWRISALPITEIYDVQGLPEKAVYVGVRITK